MMFTDTKIKTITAKDGEIRTLVTKHYQHRWTEKKGHEKRNMFTKTKRWKPVT